MSQLLYRNVLKSTSLIGGASMINILIGMVRTKFVAVWLGPAGIGLLNMFNSLVGPVATLAGMGLQTSGVRQIAEAHGKGDIHRFSLVVKTLRLTCWVSGGLGGLLLAVLSPWLCQWTFGNRDHTLGVALLGITILLGNISAGQGCVIQGTRRIKDLAKMQILGSINATIISLPLYYILGIKGVLPSLLLTSLVGLITTWWFAKRVKIEDVNLDPVIVKREVGKLLGFGLPMMLSALQTGLFAYLVRILLQSRFTLEGVGLWSAAFTLSGLLVNFVLQAMGTDYYPRLTAVSHDHEAMRHEVNAQGKIALILALPALLATMLFSPLAIQIFYSDKFTDAIPILQWMLFGVFGRVVLWPIGYVILAKGMGKLFFINELLGNGVFYLLMFFMTLNGDVLNSGKPFAFQYAIGFIKTTIIGYYLIRFKWDKQNAVTIVVSFISLVSAYIFSTYLKQGVLYYAVSILMVASTGVVCLAVLHKMIRFNLNDLINKKFKK